MDNQNGDKGGGNSDGGELVAVTIDNRRVELAAGNYTVTNLKIKLAVPVDYELDEIIHGEFKELNDNSHTYIKGGENFISHVRRGGSS